MSSYRVGVTFRVPKKVEPYAEAVRRVGLEPVLIRPEEFPGDHNLHGLLITGGTDVDPALYGREPASDNDHPDRERDQMESGLLQEFLAKDAPLFAICRGLQLWNVLAGGTLHQHIEGHRAPGVTDAHSVEVLPRTLLSAILGAGSFTVNSRHHQAVDRLGGGLIVSARAGDGTIEAIESPRHRHAIAVQWHPEDLIDVHPEAHALFVAFAQAVVFDA